MDDIIIKISRIKPISISDWNKACSISIVSAFVNLITSVAQIWFLWLMKCHQRIKDHSSDVVQKCLASFFLPLSLFLAAVWMQHLQWDDKVNAMSDKYWHLSYIYIVVFPNGHVLLTTKISNHPSGKVFLEQDKGCLGHRCHRSFGCVRYLLESLT